MIKKLQQKLKSKKGFTLIELLIVNALLGIIAAIAVPRFTGVMTGVKAKAELRSAELFAKDVQAELMTGGLEAVPSNGKLVITNAAKAGFDGDVPASQSSTGAAKTYLVATITPVADKDYYTITINVGASDGALLYTMANVSGPIN